MASFPKTSGALGLHVLVPIERRHTYDETRWFATEVARAIAGTHADLATTQWSKAKRRGVLIDASQNAKGKSIASVYSVRPMPGATVSTPLDWDEVDETLDPSIYTMEAVLDATLGQRRSTTLLLFGAVGVLLLIAAANVSGLLMARAAARHHEMAVRIAIGATRGRILAKIS